jgi:tetratricopeptide (TPR) repeat protein
VATVSTEGTAPSGDGSPYPGSRPFRRAESHLFFGRDTEASRLADLWRTNRLTIAHGLAGSGKSSLLSAGVLPLAQGGQAEILPPGHLFDNAAFPIAALPRHNPYTLALLRSWSPDEAASSLAGVTIHDFLRRRAERHSGTILAAIDQAEDLLADTGPRRSQARQFLGDLADALREWPQFHLLLSVRIEALQRFSDAVGSGARYLVPPLSFDSALRAVAGPVEGTHRSFAPDAAEGLVTDLRTSRIVAASGLEESVHLDHVDPALLQIVCARLWASLPADATVITSRDVRQHADADTALAAYCSRVLATVADNHDLSGERLHSWLRHTYIIDAGTRGTVPEGVRDTAGLPNTVVRSLEDWHLLSAVRRSGVRWYELLSDRLIEPLRRPTDKEPPTDPATHLRGAERAFLLGDLDAATRLAEKSMQAAPATSLRLHAETHSLLGNLACESGKTAEAETQYQAAAQLFEALRDTAAVARQLAAAGQMMLAQGRAAEAVNGLRAAVSRLPNDLTVQTALGWALWQLGQRRAGIDILNGVLKVDGQNPDALWARGEMLADLDNARDAMRDLDRVARPGQPSTRAARGLALAQLGQRSEADHEIEGALADAPRNGPVLFYAARAEAASGDRAAAVDLARRAIDATDPALPAHQRETARKLVGLDLDTPQ